MKSDELVEAFSSHLQRLLVPPTATDSDAVAVLFGTDEFGFNPAKGEVRLKGVGWIKCPGITKEVRRTAKWAALVRHKDEYEVIFGRGNPFETPADQTHLPTKNGVILVVPHALAAQHPELLSGYRD